MFNCARCNNQSSDGAACSLCKRRFDFACAGITEAGFRKLGDRKNTWRCPECKSGMSGLAPKVGSQEPSSPLLFEAKLNDIMKKLELLTSLSTDVKAIKEDLAGLQRSVDYAHSTIKEYAEVMKSLDLRLKVTEERIEQIPVLQAEIVRMGEQLREKDQWDRANNIELKGVPSRINENLYDLALEIGNLVGCPIRKEDINYIARIPSQQPGIPKPIVVAFNNRYKKEDLVAAARARKDLSLKDLGTKFANGGRFFINDHLTVYNKKLLTKAKSLAKERNFQYIWVKHCKIMARKNETSAIFVIKCEADLLKIV